MKTDLKVHWYSVSILKDVLYYNWCNRPFPNCLWPLFQSESWCSFFLMKINFHSHANATSFSYEKISTGTRFEKEAKGNSEMAYCKIPLKNGFAVATLSQLMKCISNNLKKLSYARVHMRMWSLRPSKYLVKISANLLWLWENQIP